MDALIIFIAKYFLYVSAAIAVMYFFKQPQKKQKEIFIFALILLPVSYLIAKIAGHFYFNPRPFVVGHFTPLFPHKPDNGFPSDHMLLAVALAAAIFRFNEKLGLVLLVFAFFVGFARILAGVHHFVDIAGSISIVLIVYAIISYFVLWRKKEKI